MSVWLGKWDELPPEKQLDIVRHFFTDDAIYEIGCLICGSLVAGELFSAEDIDKAKAFIASDDVRQTMERAGVSDKPDIYFLK